MAARMFSQLKILGNLRVVIAGSFAPDTANAPTTIRGNGFTVARTAAGTFTITLRDKYVALDSALGTVQMNAATDLLAQFGAADVASAKTVVLRTQTAATATDIAANANNRVNFALVLRNGSIAQ
jgi:hypothetical protein